MQTTQDVFRPGMSSSYVGRLAPSPTGAQHLGNARSFLFAWLLCRRADGKLLLRIEDLETPRIKPWATEQAVEDLRWLGLHWDDSRPFVQSQRCARYAEVLGLLKKNEAVYPCTCSRNEIAAMAAAPHEPALDGPIYPGTCSKQTVPDAEVLDRLGTPYAWRFRMPSSPIRFFDEVQGMLTIESPDQKLGDFVVARMNGATAYQLAVVVDDHDMDITQVVRGDDLVLSTFRQLAIYEHLNWSPPAFCHLPLVVGVDGRRLAKRHGDTRLATLRDAGIDPKTVVGYLAYRSGLLDRYAPSTPYELVSIDPLARLPRAACVLDSVNAVELFKDLQDAHLS